MADEKREPKKVRTREEAEKQKKEGSGNSGKTHDNTHDRQTDKETGSSEEKKNKETVTSKKSSKSKKKEFEQKKESKTSFSEVKEKNFSGNNKDDDEDDNDNLQEKVKQTHKAVKAAQSAYKMFNFMQLIYWLKRMFLAALEALIKAAKWLAALFNYAIHGLLGGLFGLSMTGVASSIFGTGTVLATLSGVGGWLLGGGIVIGCVVSVVNIIDSNAGNSTAYKDAPIVVECADGVLKSNVTFETSKTLNAGYNEIRTENANKIYSILYAAGFPETNIAGILGNWDRESGGLDPTAFFGIYDEPYRIGPKKQEKIDEGYSNTAIGLGQWRGGRKNNLIEYGKNHNDNGVWYEVETEVQFALTADGGDTELLNNWKAEENNPEAAALWFGKNWERAGSIDYSPREDSAAEFYARMQNGSSVLDQDFGKSILEAASYTSKAATDSATADETHTCDKLDKLTAAADNSTIVSAAVSLCRSYTEFASRSVRSTSDWGTKLYQEVNDSIHPGDKVYSKYRDCGKYVSSVIRWCGADKDYATGNTAVQYSYLCSSEKWQEIDWNGDYTKLSPGDVLITGGRGHVCIYAGYEAIAAKFPDTPKDQQVVICSASMDGNSEGYPPCCRNFYSDLGTFHAFRCVKPDNDTTYKDIGTNLAIQEAIATPAPAPAPSK